MSSAATTNYTLSLHDALPISVKAKSMRTARHLLSYMPLARSFPAHNFAGKRKPDSAVASAALLFTARLRSEEHTSELQSRPHLVCRLLLEKKKKSLLECRQIT